MPARVQCSEVRDPVDVVDHSFAVDDEMLLPVLQCRIGNPQIASVQSLSIAREEVHALVLSDDKHPIAVVLYFMNPVRPRRDLFVGRRQADLVRMQLR